MQPTILKTPSIYKGAGIYKAGAEGGGGGGNVPFVGAMQLNGDLGTVAALTLSREKISLGGNARCGFYPDIDPLNWGDLQEYKIGIRGKFFTYDNNLHIFSSGYNKSNQPFTNNIRVVYTGSTNRTLELYYYNGSSWVRIINIPSTNLSNQLYFIELVVKANNLQHNDYTFKLGYTNQQGIPNKQVYNLVEDFNPGLFLNGFGKLNRSEVSYNFYQPTEIDLNNTYVKFNGEFVFGKKTIESWTD